jgi:hypothetical protein
MPTCQTSAYRHVLLWSSTGMTLSHDASETLDLNLLIVVLSAISCWIRYAAAERELRIQLAGNRSAVSWYLSPLDNETAHAAMRVPLSNLQVSLVC